jgi:ribosome-binding factor A
MSQRTRKVASLIHQTIALQLSDLMNTPSVTITGVDVSPDLRNATGWVAIIADSEDKRNKLMATVQYHRDELQRTMAAKLTTKFVPRLELKLDTGADHADKIAKILRNSVD